MSNIQNINRSIFKYNYFKYYDLIICVIILNTGVYRRNFMIIDMHVHESRYSSDSFLTLNDATKRARSMGIDGICITDHDSNNLKNEIGNSAIINGVLVIVGAEILTFEGDIVVFGLEDLPKEKVSAEDLLSLVKKENAVAIAAHPFRNKKRSLGNNLTKFSNLLSAAEGFNGGTHKWKNIEAFNLANKLNIPCVGSSDAHKVDQLGSYVTKFHDRIRDHKDIIEAIKSGNYKPLKWNANSKSFDSITWESTNTLQSIPMSV